ncbi:MAG: hypothetical protein GF344_03020 [Chitinivibrionales bacterium]|nr:hypothetical protein [Chitinivibrionales bacterium]MBD3356051.1 hypothetical protein [Chitinivibrionales bacterium]
MSKYSIIFLLLIFSTVFLRAREENEDITAEGRGAGQTEIEALTAAKRDAVEKGIGSILLSQTEIENFRQKRGHVVPKMLRAIKDYNIVDKKQTAEGAWECTIKATLSQSTLHDDLAAFHILLESMEKPKVMIIVQEINIGNEESVHKAAETAILKLYRDSYGFEVVDPSVAASIRSSEAKMAKMAGDVAAASRIAAAYGAQMLVTGDAESHLNSESSNDLAGMKSVKARVKLRAVNCAVETVVDSADILASHAHISPNTAGTESIAKAAVEASRSLLDPIIEDWNTLLTKGMQLGVTVKGVSTFRTKNAVLKTLRSISGVSAVSGHDWNEDNETLRTDIRFKGNANGFAAEADGYKMSAGGGSLAVTGLEGKRIVLAVQVK